MVSNANGKTVDYIVNTTLTVDNKGIEYGQTKIGDTIAAQTKYEYDAEGNVINMREWTADANADGTIDENDEYKSVSAVYEDTPQLHKRSYTTGSIKNADNEITDSVTVSYYSDI